MKNILTIFLTCFVINAQAQLTPAQEKQVKVKTDSIAKVLRAEVKAWTDRKLTIDSAQNMQIRRDSSDLTTIKPKLDAALKDLTGYQLIQVTPLTPEEIDAFIKVIDKLKSFIIK